MFRSIWVMLALIIGVRLQCEYTLNTQGRELTILNHPHVENCLMPVRLDRKSVKTIKLRCERAEITQLNKEDLAKFTRLQLLKISQCPIAHIQHKAFKNISRVSEIAINHAKLMEISHKLFTHTPLLHSLDLAHNQIDLIKEDAFGHLPDLEQLDLSYNNVTVWNEKWFRNTPQRHSIALRHNFLKRVPAKAFKNLPSLAELNLSHNRIALVDPSAFEEVKNLKELDLSHNHLSSLPIAMFTGTSNSRMTVNLELNLLNHLPQELLQTMLSRITSGASKVDIFDSSSQCSRAGVPQCAFSKASPNDCRGNDPEVTQTLLTYISQKTRPISRSRAP